MVEPRNLLEGQFQDLLKKAYPGTSLDDFPPGQVREMRRMFMAGAKALYKIIEAHMSPDSGEPTVTEMAVVASIEAELEEFVAAVVEGRA